MSLLPALYYYCGHCDYFTLWYSGNLCLLKYKCNITTNNMREKRAWRLRRSSSILCCPKVYWSLTRKRPSLRALPLRDPLHKFSYADQKLCQMVLNISPQSLMDRLTCSDLQVLTKFCICLQNLFFKETMCNSHYKTKH